MWTCAVLSNAGKFTTGGDVRVSVALVRLSQARIGGSPRAAKKKPKCFGRGGNRVGVPSALSLAESNLSSPITRYTTISQAIPAVNPTGSPDPSDDELYLSITVSNPRSGPLIPNTEDCFVPFKNKTGSKGATPSYFV